MTTQRDLGTRRVKFGAVGVGALATNLIKTLANHPQVELTAAFDTDTEALGRFQRDLPEVKIFSRYEDFLKDADVEAVSIWTPNHLHASMAQMALEDDKHVYVEKPMAATLEEADSLVMTAEKRGLNLEVDTPFSHWAPVRKIVEIVRSNELGRLQAIHYLKYDDWLALPRTVEEMDPELGGGMIHRQGPHQFDLIRTIGGGLVRSVRGSAHMWDWDPRRQAIGSYTAFLEFQDEAVATLVFSGYDRFWTKDLIHGPVSKETWSDPSEYRRTWRRTQSPSHPPEGEVGRGSSTQTGGSGSGGTPPTRSVNPNPYSAMNTAILLVSCDKGDIRLATDGLAVYGEEERRLISVDSAEDVAGGSTLSNKVIRDFHDSIVSGGPRKHDGRWGLGTFEVCMAVAESARQRQEVLLSRQVGNPDYL